MRRFRNFMLLAVSFFVLLAPSAKASTNVQINYKVAVYMTGIWPSGGKNVYVYLGDKFAKGAKQRRVDNDCNPFKRDGTPLPAPAVGYWLFNPHDITAKNCAAQPIISDRSVLPKDYDYISRHAIQKGCKLIRREARRRHVRSFSCGYRYWKTYEGTAGRSVITRPCNGSHSPYRLSLVSYASDRVVKRVWCDGYDLPK
jgi:hypothetical protein